MPEERLYVVLGCFGRRDDNFVSCRAVENRILWINKSLNDYDKIMDYLESLRLFDRPLFDVNAIKHFLFNMRDRYIQGFKPIWSEKYFRLFEKFLLDHKACGAYLKLIVVDPQYDEKLEDEPEVVKIKGTQ